MAEIVTEGTGWVEQLGDRAELSVEFAATASTRTEAVAELGVRLRAVDVPVVAAQTVRDRNLWVQDEWRVNQVSGSRAAQSMMIVVTDVAVLEELLGVLIAAEPSSLSGPRWTLIDEAAARQEAQRRAVAGARARAEGYALALGGTLGRLVRLSEAAEYGGIRVGHPGGPAGAPMSSATPDIRELGLEPQPVRVQVQCTTTWFLES